MGVDKNIDQAVSDLKSSLWIGNETAFYGRCFRNEKRGQIGTVIKPEVYTSSTDYVEVLTDDTKAGQCFFDVQPTNGSDENGVYSADTWICFMVNLSKVYPSLTRTEGTEQAHTDAEEILSQHFNITGLVRGFEGFKGYDFGGEHQAHVDMHPYYLFRFNTNIKYNNSNDCRS